MCREALLVDQKWSGGSSGGLGVVGRPFRSVRSSRDALSKGQEWSRGPPVGPGVVGSPTHSNGSGWEAL